MNKLTSLDTVAFFDADGTMLEGFSIFPLFAELEGEGLVVPKGSERLDEVLMQYEADELTYADFAVKTFEVAAEVLKGKQVEPVQRVSDDFFESMEWFDYVEPVTARFRQAGVGLFVVTAEPTFMASSIQRALGFDGSFGSTFGINSDQTFSGSVESVLGSSKKAAIVERFVSDDRFIFAFGDSDGDIGMLEQADAAYCIKPTPALRAKATEAGWRIVDQPDRATFSSL